MKFKYNFIENKLTRIVGEYSYLVSEDSYFHNQQEKPSSDGFHLGDQAWITFTLEGTKIKVFYQNNDQTYQKKIPINCEITFEFTETDRLDSG